MTGFVQLPLSLPYRKAFGREDFLVAPSNREAVSWVDKWPNWPYPAVLIYGEKGSGKTHLASIFSEYHIEAKDLTSGFLPYFQKKVVVENLDELANERALFHLFNFMAEMGGYLLLTARRPPQFLLPDLKSRMLAVPKAAILMPDEHLVRSFFEKAFHERHVLVEPNVLDFAVRHVARSFPIIHQVIRLADEKALAGNRKITIPIIKEAVAEAKEAQPTRGENT